MIGSIIDGNNLTAGIIVQCWNLNNTCPFSFIYLFNNYYYNNNIQKGTEIIYLFMFFYSEFK